MTAAPMPIKDKNVTHNIFVREGIGWLRRLACWKHGPDFSDCYFPPKSSVSKSPTVTAGK